MSSTPNPVTEATRPFEPELTPAMDRANRLMAVIAHPGFREVMSISEELVRQTREAADDFGGWDPQQIVMMKVRSQAAKEHHQLLLARIKDAIAQGIAEGREKAASLPEKSAAEVLEQGDLVRQAVLQKFEEFDMRIPGSYSPEEK